jgi:hypothetical protein
VKAKSLVNRWWKIALVALGTIFVFLMILGLIVGPPPAKAGADNAVKACRSSDAAPRDELLGSRSSVKPDGTWTPHEDSPGVYSMSQRVSDGSTDRNPYTSSPPWICTASMAKDGLWTVTWTSGSTMLGTWYVKDAELRSIAPPRDLSGPGYGG